MMTLKSNWKGFFCEEDFYSYNLVDKHKGGFFSCTFSALNSIIQAYNTCKILPKSINIDCGLSMSCEGNKDLYNLFFRQNQSIDIQTELKQYIKGKENRVKIPIIFASRPYKEQDFRAIFPFWIKYFTPNKEIISIANSLMEKHNINPERTLGVYYRGTDKVNEEQLPTEGEYLEKVSKIFNKEEFDKILIQTDEQDFSDACCKLLKEAIILDGTIFSKTGDGVHRELRKSGVGQTENSIRILAVVYIFSLLKKIIVNTSHVSHAMCLYRGGVDDVLQYRRGEWIDGSAKLKKKV